MRRFPLVLLIVLIPAGCSSDIVTFQMRYPQGLKLDPRARNDGLQSCNNSTVTIANGSIIIDVDKSRDSCIKSLTDLVHGRYNICSYDPISNWPYNIRRFTCTCDTKSANCRPRDTPCELKNIWTDYYTLYLEVECKSPAPERKTSAAPMALKQSNKGNGQNSSPSTNWEHPHNTPRKMGNANVEKAKPRDSVGKSMQAQKKLLHSEKPTPIPNRPVVQIFSSANTGTSRKPSTLAVAPAESFPPYTDDDEDNPKEQMATSPSIWPSGKCLTCEGHCLSTVTIGIILGPCIVLVLGFGVGIGFLIARIWPDNLKVINVIPPPLPSNQSEVEKSVVSEITEPPTEAQTVTSQVGSTMQGNTTTTTATKFTKDFEVVCHRPSTTNRSHKVPIQSIIEGATHTYTTIDTAKDKTVLDNP